MFKTTILGVAGRPRARGFVMAMLAVGALAIDGDDVRAADAKVYPGAMCAASTWTTYVNRATTAGSIIVDYHTTLYCPAIGDSESTSTSGLTNLTRVRVHESGDPPPAGLVENTRCTVYSYSPGMVLFDSYTASADGSGQRTIPLELTKTGGPQNPLYFLKCTLTGGSTFYEYEVEEE